MRCDASDEKHRNRVSSGFPQKANFHVDMTDAEQPFSKAEDEIILDVCICDVATESAKISLQLPSCFRLSTTPDLSLDHQPQARTRNTISGGV